MGSDFSKLAFHGFKFDAVVHCFYGRKIHLDFNAPSTRWRYSVTNAMGKILDFIDTNIGEFLHNDETVPTLMDHPRNTSYPDILLVHHQDLNKISHTLTPPSGAFSYKMLLINVWSPSYFRHCKKPKLCQ